MTIEQSPFTDIRRLIDEANPTLMARSVDSDWLSAVRGKGAKDALHMLLPNRKHEAWRYTPTSFLDKTRYHALVDGPIETPRIADMTSLLLPIDGGIRLVFINGFLAPGLSMLESRDETISISSLSGGLGSVKPVMQGRIDVSARTHDNVFSALNSALMTDGALIRVTGDCADSVPLEILHLSVDTGTPGICHPRHVILVEEGARADVIERYCSYGSGDVFTNARIDITLDARSALRHQRMLEEDASARHYSALDVHLGGDSRYALAQVSLGSLWSRADVRVTFSGEGAEAEMDGVILAGDGQVSDVHFDVRHDVPRCTSRETFKGILGGKGKVVFDGRILVAKDAQKTDAQLANDNLMLSRSAEVDSKPQLEIYADDVKCSHGTTVGELDADMLFYLRSRGIKADRALQMLSQGFAQAIVDRIPDEALRDRAGQMLERRLAHNFNDAAEAAVRG